MKWIDKLIADLKKDSGDENAKQTMARYLKADYEKEMILYKELEAEAQHLPYEHLKKEALELANKEKTYAEKIASLLNAMDIRLDNNFMSYEVRADGQFSEIIKIENDLRIQLIEHFNFAENKGFRNEAKTLKEIKNSHYNNIDKIERILMRVNATI